MDVKTEAAIRREQDRILLEEKIAEALSHPSVTRNEDGSFTLKLFEPLTLRDKSTVSELKIRRPKPKDMKATDKLSDTAKAEAMLERLTGIPMETLTDMDLAEFNLAGFIVADLVGKARATGGSS